ncbi:UNVERIFIED_CONTAM: hypothetical protein FKN15_051841 [Acipenser sinensis]
MINRNNSAQREQNEKWRLEREPTELDLLLQKWEQAEEAQQPPAAEELLLVQGQEEESFPEPEEVELWPSLEPLAAIKGEEVLSPEPEEVKSAPPPQLHPAAPEAPPALVSAVPCPLLLDTLPVCLDLPALDLEPRRLHHWPQLCPWFPTPLSPSTQTSLGCCQTSLVLPLFAASLALGDRTSLRWSPGEDLCPLLHPPVPRPSLQSPLSSRWGPVLPVRGPSNPLDLHNLLNTFNV